MTLLSPQVFIALLGGLLPALLWLAFWLFEDRCEPEPKRYIFYTFAAGMVAVVAAFFIEKSVIPYLDPQMLQALCGQTPQPAECLPNPQTVAAWAATEDILIFAAAYVTSLRSYVFNEPLDAIIYMVTAALGFSAIENALFLFGSFSTGSALHSIIAGDLRFIGATLLHTLSGATVGIALALSFYKSRAMRALYAFGGVVLGITLHALFNFFILNYGSVSTFWVFLCIWFGIIAVLLLIERVKYPARDYC